MTDKQIIIDGVNVGKCRYFLKDTEGQDYDTDEFVKGCCEAKGSCIGYEFAGYGLCRGDKDCYFKQLARKTQLSIKQSEELIRLRKELQESTVKNRNLKQECEELKKYIKEDLAPHAQVLQKENDNLKEKFKKFFGIDNQECWDIAFLKDENARYRKALEEIEEIVSKDYYDDTWADISIKIDKILDIINKAKGEGNGN